MERQKLIGIGRAFEACGSDITNIPIRNADLWSLIHVTAQTKRATAAI
jgi:hypothetical protein